MSVALAGPCGAEDLKKGVEALATIEPEHQVTLATAALAIACNFPKPMEELMGQYQQMPPEYLAMIDLKLATVAIGDWVQACPGGPNALAEMMQLAPSEQRSHIYGACKLEDNGHYTREEWTASSGLTVAPILLGDWLVRLGGADKKQARAYARALAGISDRAQDNPVKTFEPLIP